MVPDKPLFKKQRFGGIRKIAVKPRKYQQKNKTGRSLGGSHIYVCIFVSLYQKGFMVSFDFIGVWVKNEKIRLPFPTGVIGYLHFFKHLPGGRVIFCNDHLQKNGFVMWWGKSSPPRVPQVRLGK